MKTTRQTHWTAGRVVISIACILILVPLMVWAGRSIKFHTARALLTDSVRTEREARVAGVPTSSSAGGGDISEQFNFNNLQIPREEIRHGGPPKDGIPALTNPESVSAGKADFLADDERIVGVTINSSSRGYPLRLLDHHEIINDTLGGKPIAVIYCPLCDSVSVVERTMDGKTLEFGVSGLLYNSNVIFFDRSSDALWTQVGMQALSGPYAGRSLEHLAGWQLVNFGRWKSQRPRSTVVTFTTGYSRNYERQMYKNYRSSDEPMFELSSRDDRLPAKTPVVGVELGDLARAYRVDRSDGGASKIDDKLAGEQIVIEHDAQTGRIEIVQVPREAKVVHTFWFAWAAFHPQTELFRSGQ